MGVTMETVAPGISSPGKGLGEAAFTKHAQNEQLGQARGSGSSRGCGEQVGGPEGGPKARLQAPLLGTASEHLMRGNDSGKEVFLEAFSWQWMAENEHV